MSAFKSTLKSPFEPEPVRRLEVINGDVGRRRWPDEVKARIVAETLTPGVVISEVARRHGIRPQQLFAWRRLARDGRLALPQEALAFAPVVVADAPPSTTTPSRASQATPDEDTPIVSDGEIEIAYRGAVIRVGAGVDASRVVAVLKAVKAAR